MSLKTLLIPIFLIFSVLTIPAFAGEEYSIEGSYQSITDDFNLGTTLNSSEIDFLELEIDDQYSSKTDPYDIDTTGLVAWYRFDDAGTNVIDYSGNGNNGTFAAATYADGKYNNCGSFDGVDDVVSIPILTSEAYTIAAWVSGKNGYFILDGNDQNTLGFRGGLTPAGNQLYLRINGDGDGISWYGPYIDGTQPNHIVYCIWNEGGHANLKAYVNSELVATKMDFTFEFDSPNSIGYLGTQWSSTYACLNGTLDEFLVYNETKTREQIEMIYYISASSIKAKTNSHAEYSTEWNSSADNPLLVPFGESESISSLTSNQPESIEQNGVTIYNPTNVYFKPTLIYGNGYRNNGSLQFYAPTGLSYTVYQNGTYYTDNTSDGIVYTNSSDNYSFYIKQDALTVLTDPGQTSSYIQSYLTALLGLIFLLFPLAGLYLIYRRGV